MSCFPILLLSGQTWPSRACHSSPAQEGPRSGTGYAGDGVSCVPTCPEFSRALVPTSAKWDNDPRPMGLPLGYHQPAKPRVGCFWSASVEWEARSASVRSKHCLRPSFGKLFQGLGVGRLTSFRAHLLCTCRAQGPSPLPPPPAEAAPSDPGFLGGEERTRELQDRTLVTAQELGDRGAGRSQKGNSRGSKVSRRKGVWGEVCYFQ